MDLSVLIPSRNEEWLNRTVADVLEHAKADTEVIVVLDGAWPIEPLPQHPRVKVVFVPEPIGQRAATNLAARLSSATYVMKLDAHCSLADGFDRALIYAAKELGPDVTQIPAQRNLHIFNWVCDCGFKKYQCGLDKCPDCGGPLTKDVIWNEKPSPLSTNWVFDSEPKFKYASNKHQTGDICDVMTSLGACFFMARERFWQLGGLDEAHGIWGSFGIEIACKSALSGGRHVVNRRTWFAHFFRVGGQKFPYPLSGSQQDAARKYAKHLWFRNAWPGQVKPLRWLVEQFWPVAGWTQADLDALPPLKTATPTAGVVYYSDGLPDADILNAAKLTIERSGLPIVAVTLQPHEWPAAHVVTVPLQRGYLTMFRQILAGLEALDTDYAFLCEHDVLYSPSHFQFRPPNRTHVFYNQHVWKVDIATGKALHYRCSQTSGLCADRQLLIEHYRTRVALVEARGFSRQMGFEPGTHRRDARVDDLTSDVWMSEQPNVDIRHGHNLTPSRWKKAQFKNPRYTAGWTESTVDHVPGWPDILERVGRETQQAVA